MNKNKVSETEKKLMEIFGKTLPTMTELEKERFLVFGEGMAFMARQTAPPAGQQAQPGA